MPAPDNKRELQAFLGIIKYLGKFSPGTAVVYDPLWKLTSSKGDVDKECIIPIISAKNKLLIKSDMCMKFYNNSTTYLKTDMSGVGLGTALLQTWDSTICQKDMVPDNTILHLIAFASESLTDAEHRYSNIEREVLGILHRLKKFHHYCFKREVYAITDHKSLLSIF